VLSINADLGVEEEVAAGESTISFLLQLAGGSRRQLLRDDGDERSRSLEFE